MAEPLEYSRFFKDRMRSAIRFADHRKFFNEFSRKFTVLPCEWMLWARIERDRRMLRAIDITVPKINWEKLQAEALSCFYQENLPLITGKIPENFHFLCYSLEGDDNRAHSNFFHFATENWKIKKILSRPHKRHKYLFNECDMFSLKQIAPNIMEKYHKAIKFWELIKDKPIEEYVYLLSNIDFAIESVEWELGRNPLSVNFWKFYIEFLKTKSQQKALLNIYSRYCRLFTDDKDMRNEYYNTIKQLDDSGMYVIKWWIDYIGIEKHFGSIEAASDLVDFVKTKKPLSSNSKLSNFFESLSLSNVDVDISRKSFSNVKIKYLKGEDEPSPSNIESTEFKKFELNFPKNQTFSFPRPFMAYIFITAKNGLKHTLFQTCKYLFYRGNQVLCHNICFSSHFQSLPTFREQSLILHPKNVDLVNLKKYCVTNTLQIISNDEIYENLFSRTINSFKYDIKHIKFVSQRISIEELTMLPCHQIKTAMLENVIIINSNKEVLAIEDLIGLFPNATTKRIITNFFNENSSENFRRIQLPIKLNSFTLFFIISTFDSNNFVDFLKENVEEDAYVFIKFHQQTGFAFRKAFEENVKRCLPKLDFLCKKSQ